MTANPSRREVQGINDEARKALLGPADITSEEEIPTEDIPKTYVEGALQRETMQINPEELEPIKPDELLDEEGKLYKNLIEINDSLALIKKEMKKIDPHDSSGDTSGPIETSLQLIRKKMEDEKDPKDMAWLKEQERVLQRLKGQSLTVEDREHERAGLIHFKDQLEIQRHQIEKRLDDLKKRENRGRNV